MKIKKILAVVWGNQETQPVSSALHTLEDSYESKEDIKIQNVEIQNVRVQNIENEEKVEKDPDADRINDIIRNYSKQMRKMGRYTAFSLIAASWTFAYKDGGFTPTTDVKLTLLFAVVYLIVDYLYLFFIVRRYKWTLRHYYDSIRGGGFKLKNNMDSYKSSRITSGVSTFIQYIITTILGLAAFFIIKHIVSL